MNRAWWRDRRVLVTGGAGFIGSAVCRALGGRVRHLRVVDNLERGRIENLRGAGGDVDFRQDDLRDPSVAAAACGDVDVVLHFAAKVGGITLYVDHPYETAATNARIDTNIFHAAATAGVRMLVYASSAHVYPAHLQAAPNSPALSEGDAYPANPELAYGWEKLFAERLLEGLVFESNQTKNPLSAAVLRLVGAYGPDQDDDLSTGSAIPVFIRRALEYPGGGPLRVRGTGAETRSYCFIDDVLEAIFRTAELLTDTPWVAPLNIGTEGRVTIAEVARLVVVAAGRPVPIEFDPSVATTVWGQAVSCRSARDVLGGWTPRIPLDEGIRRCFGAAAARRRPGG